MVDSVSNAVTPLADGAISAGLTGVKEVVTYFSLNSVTLLQRSLHSRCFFFLSAFSSAVLS